ncbi:MAG: hypothetical protein DLM73_12360 [Chthoniobacterales bacterium]|nr:MAG: hypothetical protein DLM73_12360 [Chthoniobacterales bacterium]
MVREVESRKAKVEWSRREPRGIDGARGVNERRERIKVESNQREQCGMDAQACEGKAEVRGPAYAKATARQAEAEVRGQKRV